MIHLARTAVAVVLLCWMFGCATELSPQEQVRQTLEDAENFARDRNLDQLREFVSKDYMDAEGRDRRGLTQMVALYFRNTDTLFLRTRAGAIDFVGSDEAHATVVAAIADVPIDDLDLNQLSADFVRFELTLRHEGKDWKIVEANWKSISLPEFLN